MELELQGWKVKLALAAMAAVVVVLPFARGAMVNRDRAEDWHKRAVVAEESVGGLRAVIAERSRALNQRTIQANRLAARADENGTALRRSKVSVGALTQRRQELARAYARVSTERDRFRSRLAAVERIGATLSACAKGAAAPARGKRTTTAARSRLASCRRASASFDDYLRQAR
jgi:uncharacterized membrane protein